MAALELFFDVAQAEKDFDVKALIMQSPGE
jgi:hypothetical protein